MTVSFVRIQVLNNFTGVSYESLIVDTQLSVYNVKLAGNSIVFFTREQWLAQKELKRSALSLKSLL